MSIHPEQHPLDGKLEPETKDCFNDRAPLYSIAISLKRIADAPSEAAARITELETRLEGARGGEPLAWPMSIDRGVVIEVAAEALWRSGGPEGHWSAAGDGAQAVHRAWAADVIEAISALFSPAEPSGWRPMESAPKDGTYILARVAPQDDDDRWGYLSGRCFVIRHEERTPSGYDLGWSVFPGFGGVSDDWFEGWLTLPPTSEGGVA